MLRYNGYFKNNKPKKMILLHIASNAGTVMLFLGVIIYTLLAFKKR